MIELERKKRLLRSAFSNGLDFLDGMYAINDNPIGRDEVEELASDVEAMVGWYFKYLNQEDAGQKAYQQGRKDAIDEVVERYIYPLLDEYDIECWENINYIELADMWVELIERFDGDEEAIKTSIKEQIKEQKNEHIS